MGEWGRAGGWSIGTRLLDRQCRQWPASSRTPPGGGSGPFHRVDAVPVPPYLHDFIQPSHLAVQDGDQTGGGIRPRRIHLGGEAGPVQLQEAGDGIVPQLEVIPTELEDAGVGIVVSVIGVLSEREGSGRSAGRGGSCSCKARNTAAVANLVDERGLHQRESSVVTECRVEEGLCVVLLVLWCGGQGRAWIDLDASVCAAPLSRENDLSLRFLTM
jgi:hypothetical protein